jgi:hypothetical protein
MKGPLLLRAGGSRAGARRLATRWFFKFFGLCGKAGSVRALNKFLVVGLLLGFGTVWSQLVSLSSAALPLTCVKWERGCVGPTLGKMEACSTLPHHFPKSWPATAAV